MLSIILLIGFFYDKYQKLYTQYKEIINYLIVGVITTVVSIASYNLFRVIIENYLICTILSWIVAVVFAYITNRKYVFESKEKNITKEFIQFVISRLFSLLSEIVTMYVLVEWIGINDKLSKIIVQFIIVILNYVFSKLFVFNNKVKKL